MAALHSRRERNQHHSRVAHQPDEQHQRYRHEVRAFLATLSHEQRRPYAAIESNRLGRGGVVSVAELTGLGKPTSARGRRELGDLLQGKPLQKGCKAGPGRPRTEQTYPGITAALEELLSDEVAGSPEKEHKWVRSSVVKLTQRLRAQGFPVGHNAGWALLKRMGFSLRTALRKRRGLSACTKRVWSGV